MAKPIYIRKATGGKDKFRPEKIKNTCLRAGADYQTAEKIARRIAGEIYNGISTRKILEKIHHYLREVHPALSNLYSLKAAMTRLGPTGFIFEEYCTRLFRFYGWKATNAPPISGFCIKHEIDITLENKPKKGLILVECKYHNSRGIYCGSKDILYTWARFLDLKEGYEAKRTPCRFTDVWLVTNTKFSDYAKQFSVCKGIKLLGWNWPREKSLADYIEKAKFWPITILSNLDRYTRWALFKEKVILVKDILAPDFTLKKVKISFKKISALQKEAREIMEFHKS